jgi:hypothetical protein
VLETEVPPVSIENSGSLVRSEAFYDQFNDHILVVEGTDTEISLY